MKIIKAFFMSLSMFTRIPSFYHGWDEKARPYMLLTLPFVGLLIGGLWCLLGYGLSLTTLPKILIAFILTVFPLLLTGFIHFDGYMDVVDALFSYRPYEKRIEILKDPHVGSFAVVYSIILLLANFALFACLSEEKNYYFLIFIPAVSRTMSGLALTVFPTLQVSEYSKINVKEKKTLKIIYFIFLLIFFTTICYLLCNLKGLVIIAVIIFHLLATLKAKKSLKGVNGDTCGYALSIAESLSLIVIVLLEVL